MRIGVDAENASKLQTALVPPPVQVQSPRIGIDFHSDAMLGTGSENRIDIDVVAWSTQELSSSHVPKNRCIRIGYSTDNPLGLRTSVLSKLSMHAGHDKVETGEYLIRVIKRAIRQNVRLQFP
jgi:hypothetical protein